MKKTVNQTHDAVADAARAAYHQLLAEQNADGFWPGELSPSAVGTATAVIAFSLAERAGVSEAAGSAPLRKRGVAWLCATQNADGGWGDSPKNLSNPTAAALALCALRLEGERDARARGEVYLKRQGGFAGLVELYGRDRTFSVPVLTVAAGAGYVRFGQVPALPFELALVPRRLLGAIGVPVVSYALPALIAMGICRFRRQAPWDPVRRGVRRLSERPALRLMRQIQPASGGFLEATPLTAFVCSALTLAGHVRDETLAAGLRFLRRLARADGSWPIDANLSVWNTCLATQAILKYRLGLSANAASSSVREQPDRLATTRNWLLAQQRLVPTPYTDAALSTGGWAWTHLPGGVPDADDTSQVIYTLRLLGVPPRHPSLVAGRRWLLNLQNRDGGFPTFTRGRTSLPFDQSSVDITAHALRALAALGEGDSAQSQSRSLARSLARSTRRALRYLESRRQPDGWSALWFGNENENENENKNANANANAREPDCRNFTYGTSQVVEALLDIGIGIGPKRHPLLEYGVARLLRSQNPDGGWGGAPSLASTPEETALAVSALARHQNENKNENESKNETALSAARTGAAWLAENQDADGSWPPTPIGLYFARLWYYERLYPLVFGLKALATVNAARNPNDRPPRPSESSQVPSFAPVTGAT